MTALVVVGILTIVSVPSYQNYVMEAKTGEAYQTLGTMISQQRTFFIENKYFGTTALQGGPNSTWSLTSGSAMFGWTPIGIPVAGNARTHFYYGANAGIFNRYRPPATSLGTWNYAYDGPTDTGFFISSAYRSAQICVSQNVSAGLASVSPVFTATTLGISTGTSISNPTATTQGDYNWVIVGAMAQKGSSGVCRYIAAVMDGRNNTGNTGVPRLLSGFLKVDYDFSSYLESGTTTTTSSTSATTSDSRDATTSDSRDATTSDSRDATTSDSR